MRPAFVESAARGGAAYVVQPRRGGRCEDYVGFHGGRAEGQRVQTACCPMTQASTTTRAMSSGVQALMALKWLWRRRVSWASVPGSGRHPLWDTMRRLCHGGAAGQEAADNCDQMGR